MFSSMIQNLLNSSGQSNAMQRAVQMRNQINTINSATKTLGTTLRDNNGLRDEHKRMGLGNIDFQKLFDKLKEVGYDHLHCMEVIFNKKEELIAFAGDLSKYDN